MPGYLVDEGGERTHAVVPVEEYERLKKAAENLETVRGHAAEIMAVINCGDSAGGVNPAEPEAARLPSVPPQEDAAQASSRETDEAATTEEESGEGRARGYGWQR